MWVGDRFSDVEKMCVASFIDHGHRFDLYTYGPVANLPDGVNLCDANAIIPQDKIYKAEGSFAAFADQFRWTLLFMRGGVWVDTDVVCVKPFDFEDEFIYALEQHDSVNVAVLGVPQGHRFAMWMLQNAERPFRLLPYDSVKDKAKKIIKRFIPGETYSKVGWGAAAGPEAATRALRHFDMFKLAKPATAFYPVHYYDWRQIFEQPMDSLGLGEDTYAVHLWNEMSRRDPDFDRFNQDEPNSLFKSFERQHLHRGTTAVPLKKSA
jgi:hypothetical protein